MHSLFIAQASIKPWFDAAAEHLGSGGPPLVLALSADGRAPATHGWCAVSLSPEKEADVADLIAANPDKGVVWKRYDMATDPGAPDRIAAALGLRRITPAFA